MEYCVKRIKSREEITSCQRFEVSHFLWVDVCKPKTYGYLGYLEGEGLYAEMYCREKAPRRVCTGPDGRFSKEKGKRVCDDSAMEIFVGFSDGTKGITQNALYLNFEINANGEMYGNYGKGRKNRSFLPEEVYRQAAPRAFVGEDSWKIQVLFPEKFLQEISGVEIGKPGTKFYCNFYKISETPEIEHYGCYAPIENDTPNFHLPQYFAEAVVQ